MSRPGKAAWCLALGVVVLLSSCSGEKVFLKDEDTSCLRTEAWAAGKYEGSVIPEETPCGPEAPPVAEFVSSLVRGMHYNVQVLRFLTSRSRPGDCQFRPSCGEYSRQAISKYGPVTGFFMTGDRLIRCNRTAKLQPYPRKKIGDKYYMIDLPEEHYIFSSGGDGAVPHAVDDGDLPPGAQERRKPARDRINERTRELMKLAAPPGGEIFPAEVLSKRPEDEAKQFSFAAELTREGHLYRAITEFYRFAFLYKESPLAPYAGLMAGECYLAGRRYSHALVEYGKAAESLEGGMRYFAHLRAAISAYYLGEFDEMEKRVAEVMKSGRGDYEAAARYLAYMRAVRNKKPDAASAALGVMRDNYSESYERLLIDAAPSEILDGRDLPGRSPLLGGVMSTLIPGLGQIYSGQVQDGLSSFSMVVAFGAASYLSFKEDAEVPGYVMGALALSFYMGNVYGGFDSARTYNRRAEEGFYRRVRERSFPGEIIVAPSASGVFAGLGYEF